MNLTNLYSLMRVLLIAVRHIVAVRGLSKARKQLVKHFLTADDGKSIFYLAVLYFLILISRFSVLPALALNDGIIHCDIVEGAFDSNLFYTFISRLLDEMNPFPAAKSVVVMDNCRIHKMPEALELIEAR
jgi:hypothetical protein